MKFSILTQFPDMFASVTESSIIGRAIESGLVDIEVTNIRDYTKDKHKRTDDTPFGGGAGMVMTPQPAFDALNAIGTKGKRIIYMSPRGKMLDKEYAQELSSESEVVILCGHYEGIDQRIIDAFNMEEVSIGDYILTGGELPAMVLIDTTCRLIPGVLGNEDSPYAESIYSGLLEADMYTKPRVYESYEVPEVLFNGNHKLIHLWQYENSLKITKNRRPDLFDAYVNSIDESSLSKDEQKILRKIKGKDKDLK